MLQHKPEWVLYHEFVLTSKNFIRTALDIDGEWLFEVAPQFFDPDNIKDVQTKRDLMKLEREVIAKQAKKAKEKEKTTRKRRFNFSDVPGND